MTKHPIVFGCALLLAAASFCPAQTLSLRPIDPLGGLGDEPAPAAKPATLPEKKEDEKKAPTEITCEKEATFEEKAHKAIFIGGVVVKDPDFNLTCDKLTAFLRQAPEKKPEKNVAAGAKSAPDSKSTAGKAGATPAAKNAGVKPAASVAAKSAANKNEAGKVSKNDPAEQPQGTGGIDRALAEGNVVIIQDKVDAETGETKHYVGRSIRADYDANTGDIVLSGDNDPSTWPQLQEGINTHIAIEPGVVMILNRSGALHSKGKTKTVISDQGDDKSKTKKPK